MDKARQSRSLQTLLWMAVIMAAWEVSSRAGLVNSYILPPLSQVLPDLLHEIVRGRLGLQALNSLYVIVLGFAISLALAAVICLLCVWLTPLEGAFSTLATIFNPLPSLAVLPLVVMWFGVSTGAMLVIIVHGVLWALVRHILDGMRAIPKVYLEWGRNVGLSSWQMFRRILIFAIMPELLAGIRVGWGRAWRALISAEMVFGLIGELGGLGYYIYTHRAYANMTHIMSGVLLIIIIGMTVESALFKYLEKKTVIKWGMVHE